MNTEMADLAELLETIIEETPGFDEFIRRQLEEARDQSLISHLHRSVDECYDNCHETLQTIKSATKAVGFEWDVMSGAVELYRGMFLYAENDLSRASNSFKESAKHFQNGNCIKGEVLAYVGLARCYHKKAMLSNARKAYEEAFARLKSFNLDSLFRKLKRDVEHTLHEIHDELAATGPISSQGTPPYEVNRHAKPIAVYGEVKAGYPGFMNVNPPEDWYIVDDRLARGAKFGYLVKGDSMIDAGIREGDYVFVRPQPADLKPSEIAVVVITDQNEEREETLKHVEIRDDHWYLRSRNETIKPRIVVPTESEVSRIVAEYTRRNQEVEPMVGKVEIIGKVVAVLRSLT